MDKDIIEFLNWITDEDADNFLWSIDDVLKNEIEYKTFEKIFTKSQAIVVRTIINRTVHMVNKWHDKLDENSHKDIRKKIDKLQAQFRNHRHDNSKKLGGKAEY